MMKLATIIKNIQRSRERNRRRRDYATLPMYTIVTFDTFESNDMVGEIVAVAPPTPDDSILYTVRYHTGGYDERGPMMRRDYLTPSMVKSVVQT
jgi:hypothetical protein